MAGRDAVHERGGEFLRGSGAPEIAEAYGILIVLRKRAASSTWLTWSSINPAARSNAVGSATPLLAISGAQAALPIHP